MKRIFLIILILCPLLSQAEWGEKHKNGAQALREQKKANAAPDIPGNLIVDLGFNLLVDKAPEMRRNFWGSKSVGLYYTYDISPKKTFFSINVGLGLGLEKYALEDDITLSTIGGDLIERRAVIDTLSADWDVRKSKIATNYVELPLEIRIYTNPSEREKGMFFAIGASAGLLFQSHTKLRYSEEGINNNVKHRTDYEFNQFRARGIVRAGFRGVNVFFKFGITEWFKDGRAPGRVPTTMHTVGFSFVGF